MLSSRSVPGCRVTWLSEYHQPHFTVKDAGSEELLEWKRVVLLIAGSGPGCLQVAEPGLHPGVGVRFQS